MPPSRTTPQRGGAPAQARDDAVNFDSTLSHFYKLCVWPVLLASGLVAVGIWRARTVPIGGDPTLRYVSVGIPLFWAGLLLATLVICFVSFSGQTITINARAFIFRRGRLTIFMPWSELTYQPAEVRRWDRQFTVATKSSHVVVRSLLFPQLDEIQREVEARLRSRDYTGEVRI